MEGPIFHFGHLEVGSGVGWTLTHKTKAMRLCGTKITRAQGMVLVGGLLIAAYCCRTRPHTVVEYDSNVPLGVALVWLVVSGRQRPWRNVVSTCSELTERIEIMNLQLRQEKKNGAPFWLAACMSLYATTQRKFAGGSAQACSGVFGVISLWTETTHKKLQMPPLNFTTLVTY